MKDRMFHGKDRAPATVRITLAALLVLALGWLAFSILLAAGVNASYPRVGAFRWIMSALTGAGALLLAGLTLLLYRRLKPAWYIAVLLLAAMFLAGWMDNLGLVDYVFLAVELVLLGLLVKERRWYLHQNDPSSKQP